MTSEEARTHESLDVAIVGTGAAGVGIGAVLADLGLDSYAILERGAVGASFRQWPEEMRLITPSFPSNSFGCRDLNAVTTDTSPAFALDREHPTGGEYAKYLQGVVADEITSRLDIDRTPLDEYREKSMFLEDLSCCEPDMCDC